MKQKFQKQWGTVHIKGLAAVLLFVFCALCTAGCDGDRALTLEISGETLSAISEEQLEDPGEESASFDTSQGQVVMICVHVCGAVKQPGLVTLPAGSRTFDALELAGGFAEDANEEALNLAAFLVDGQKLYFPRVGENIQDLDLMEKQGKVNLNTADEAKLCTLPGIGESRAKAILKYRKEHGSFKKAEDVLMVPGIKEGIYEQFKDLVIAE